MSIVAREWAENEAPHIYHESGKVDTTARAILSVLAGHAHDDGTGARPSIARIVYKTGFDPRTVSRTLDRLEANGLIQATGVTGQNITIYRLLMHMVRPATEWDALLDRLDAAKGAEAGKARERRRAAKAAITAPDIDIHHAPAPGTTAPAPAASGVEIPTSGVEIPTSGVEIPTSGRDAARTVLEPSVQPSVEPSRGHAAPVPPAPPGRFAPGSISTSPTDAELTTQPENLSAPTDRASARDEDSSDEDGWPALRIVEGGRETSPVTPSLFPAAVPEPAESAVDRRWDDDLRTRPDPATSRASEAAQAARDIARASLERARQRGAG